MTFRWQATNKADGSPVNVAATLFSDGRVRFDYGPGNTNLSPTVGLSSGNGYTVRMSPDDGLATLTSVPSILYSLAPGITDVGAYEFRGSSADVTPPTVTSVTPASVVGGTANQVRIDFSEEPNPIDATATANYQLRDAGMDGVFGTSDDNVYQLTPAVRSASSTYVLLNVAGGAPLESHIPTHRGRQHLPRSFRPATQRLRHGGQQPRSDRHPRPARRPGFADNLSH